MQTYGVSLHTPSTAFPQDTVKVTKGLSRWYDYHTLKSQVILKIKVYKREYACTYQGW